MKTYTVEISCYVPGSGYSYTTDLDPIINPVCSEEELAREYAEEFLFSEEQTDDNDYLFRVYDDNHHLVSEIWNFDLYAKN